MNNGHHCCRFRLVLFAIACAGLVATGFAAAGAEPAAETIRVNATNPGPIISPLLFSYNLEHTRYAMWKGLSAELLANRKFAGKSVADGWKEAKIVRAPEGPTASWPAGKPSGSRPPNARPMPRTLTPGSNRNEFRLP